MILNAPYAFHAFCSELLYAFGLFTSDIWMFYSLSSILHSITHDSAWQCFLNASQPTIFGLLSTLRGDVDEASQWGRASLGEGNLRELGVLQFKW